MKNIAREIMDNELILQALKSLKLEQLKKIKSPKDVIEEVQAITLYERLIILIHKLTYPNDN